MQIECCVHWNGFRLVLVSKHIFQQCSSGPKSVESCSAGERPSPKHARMATVEMLFVLKSCFFPHLQVSYNVGLVCRLLWATEFYGGQIFNIAKI